MASDLVTITSPADGQIDVALTPSLDWEAASNATSYTVEVSLDAAFATNHTTKTGLTETQVTLDLLAPVTTFYWRVRGVNADGVGPWSTAHFVTVLNVGIEKEMGENPTAFVLHDAYPNPFNPQTTIRFSLDATSQVSLSVWDASGRMIDTLTNTTMTPGTYSFRWDASERKSGLYLIRLQAGERIDSKTVMLVK